MRGGEATAQRQPRDKKVSPRLQSLGKIINWPSGGGVASRVIGAPQTIPWAQGSPSRDKRVEEINLIMIYIKKQISD